MPSGDNGALTIYIKVSPVKNTKKSTTDASKFYSFLVEMWKRGGGREKVEEEEEKVAGKELRLKLLA